MKKILITGANSYIGTSFEKYIVEKYPEEFVVETLDMINPEWRKKDFSGYDTVFHVAGIAHRKETEENTSLYYEVNRDLTVETAEKAKAAGVQQFIFLSTMSVYGMETGVITEQTAPMPKSAYGESKLQAEQKLEEMMDNCFKVAIVRPPMVYGLGCKGNFQTVVKLVKKSPVFPEINNKRSMIHISNLCEFVKILAEEELQGLFFPQNREYVRTDKMAKIIAEKMNKKIFFSKFCGFGIWVLRPIFTIMKKAFGNLVYDVKDVDFDYQVIDFEKSIKESI